MADSASKVDLQLIRSAAGMWPPILLTTTRGDQEQPRFDEEQSPRLFKDHSAGNSDHSLPSGNHVLARQAKAVEQRQSRTRRHQHQSPSSQLGN